MKSKRKYVARNGNLEIATDAEASESPNKVERGHIGYPIKPLDAMDFVRCSRCGLRGHLPGDVDKCYPERSFRMGCWRGL